MCRWACKCEPCASPKSRLNWDKECETAPGWPPYIRDATHYTSDHNALVHIAFAGFYGSYGEPPFLIDGDPSFLIPYDETPCLQN